MRWSRLIALAALVCSAVAESFTIDNSLWNNVRYYRSVDVSNNYIKEAAFVEIINMSDSPQDMYIFPVNDGYDAIETVSYMSVTDDERSQELVPIKLAEGVYAIRMQYPIAPATTFTFKAIYVYTNTLEALPAKIGLGDKQQVLTKFNKYCYSPYKTLEYSISFSGFTKGSEYDLRLEHFNSPNIAELPELNGRIEEDANVLTYGPISVELAPYTVQPLGFWYEHNRPLARVINLERNFWIPASDIGVVQTEDYYELYHNGAGLNTGFSRADWIKGRYELAKEHFSIVRLFFPKSAEVPFDNYYFTDKVGMVSTHIDTPDELVFMPRYPLFGGWKYNFTMGWNNAIEPFVRKVQNETDTYIAKVPVLNRLKQITYDNVSINIYLPENAKFLNASSYLEESSSKVGTELSYLDVADGHVKVTLNYKNLFDELDVAHVYVKYQYSAQSYWSKVFKIAGFVFTGLMSFYALGQVDLSIKK